MNTNNNRTLNIFLKIYVQNLGYLVQGVPKVIFAFDHIQHFTSTLVVTSNKINTCSVFVLQRISALQLVSATPRLRKQLDTKDADVTSLPKCW